MFLQIEGIDDGTHWNRVVATIATQMPKLVTADERNRKFTRYEAKQ